MNWLILGGGVSGLGAGKLLKSKNIPFCIVDQNTDISKDPKYTTLTSAIYHDDKNLAHLNNITDLVLSPGIPLTHPLILSAQKKQIRIISEIDLALSYFSGKIIAVTGTNGKSTTVSMIQHLCTELNIASSLAGNIGTSFSSLISDNTIKPLVILELSSYQLEHSSLLQADVACLLNISDDHLSRHGTLENYLREKWKIFLSKKESPLFIVEKNCLDLAQTYNFNIPKFNLIFSAADLEPYKQVFLRAKITEPHNMLNAFVAVNAIKKFTSHSIEELIILLKSFKGLPHRFEVVGSFKNKRIINDSKATNVNAVLTALSGEIDNVTLFLGGQGKGESFKEILKYKDKISHIICFGAEADNIKNELSDHGISLRQYKTLHNALKDIQKISTLSKSDLIFSPGCASFDEFKNFEERGTFFKNSVQCLLKS